MSDSRENQLFEKCAENLQKDIHHSQILFKFDQGEKSLDKAKEIVKKLGVKIVDIKIFDFPKDSALFALFKLDIADMREVALVLSEHGYAPIKGFNAQLQKNLFGKRGKSPQRDAYFSFRPGTKIHE
ncbi:hypothetical protein DRJ04_02705 [Candidatus Aerophobetes bacterium]|uniref:Uncharacterized protein n=1 Tax=Aerophobetes bacterium TaxID=2030807 RepID=A0A662DJI8_UNCAE|nr:MAG: hypothetical protein DRJ04_02705 [Candidatus Aerophobetes bacterium]